MKIPVPPPPPPSSVSSSSRPALDLDAIFGLRGVLARDAHSHGFVYEARSGQVHFSAEVDAAIRDGVHLLAEAGTGTGKTVAYAVPAIYRAATAPLLFDEVGNASMGPDSHVVIATANKALQEQIVGKDLPMLAEVLPWEFRYALLKGMDNYLCLDKLDDVIESAAYGLGDSHLVQIGRWGRETKTGDRSELPFDPGDTWKNFSVSSEDCCGDACSYYKDGCHAMAARRRAHTAHVVVVNYSLLFMHFRVLEWTGKYKLLPPHRVAILDEGHEIADIARDSFGWEIGEGSVGWVGKMLWSIAGKGESDAFLADEGLVAARDVFFRSLRACFGQPGYKPRIKDASAFAALGWKDLAKALDATQAAYEGWLDEIARANDFGYRSTAKLKKDLAKKVRRIESKSRRAGEIAAQLREAGQMNGDSVYFIEEKNGRCLFKATPVSVAERLRGHLFDPAVKKTVVVSSATLVANKSFNFVAEEIGALDPRTLVASSPFRWGDQVLLVLPTDVPDPQDPRFRSVATERCMETIRAARGRTLALFTSRKGMDHAHKRALALGMEYQILKQGEMSTPRLLSIFREDIHSVLFGVATFWAGVDVQGEALSCVFIDKLPFTPPDDPVYDARCAREGSYRAFKRYSLPGATIAFKQGFGRLIRHTTDRGVVVCTDVRLLGKHWSILRSLPTVARSARISDIGPFLDHGVVP